MDFRPRSWAQSSQQKFYTLKGLELSGLLEHERGCPQQVTSWRFGDNKPIASKLKFLGSSGTENWQLGQDDLPNFKGYLNDLSEFLTEG